ncbi:uncharacterized protein LOC120662365 [Panicum virgatum]|uniref:uncharacterized protein LOC120662365 n=1 Tax=Panicum virgatum TaxID=38727 RepID=UPI0019D4F7D8|nr:uncharacterized protein LOC120662365 [Panicum virgatum]
MEVVEGGGLLQQHGAMEIQRRGCRGFALMGRGSEGGGCSLGGRPLTICARQGGVPGAGSLGGLLLCLGETGKGGVVGLLALQGDGAGPFLGQAGGNLGLLEFPLPFPSPRISLCLRFLSPARASRRRGGAVRVAELAGHHRPAEPDAREPRELGEGADLDGHLPGAGHLVDGLRLAVVAAAAAFKLTLRRFCAPSEMNTSDSFIPMFGQGLQIRFYDSYCPDAEDIVRSTVEQYYDKDATVAPALLRLHFHDCFVQGCDARS